VGLIEYIVLLMRKELLWAIGAGIFFGLIIAFGVWRANSSFKPKGESTQSSPTPASVNPAFKIVLNTPENEDVVTNDFVSVSGITSPLSWITLSGEDADYTVQADEKGTFKEDVELTSGVNQIKVTAFDPKGAESGTRVLVVYSSAFQKKDVVSENPNTDPTSSSAIRAKVEEKVKLAMSKPKTYLGTVTDITDSTIQIKSLSGEIKQITAKAEDVTVVKTDKTNKEVKLTDIGIGDFIVAMGYRNGNQVLTAQRILITEPITEPRSKAVYGVVSTVSKKSVTVAGAEVTPNKSTFIASLSSTKIAKMFLSDIEEASFVIYVTAEDSGKTSVRSIFILPKS